MGFVSPKLPRFDVHLWHWGRRAERLKPMCQHWGEHGFGTPWVVYLLYVLKMAVYLVVGLVFIAATPGIGPMSDIANWWTQPVVFQKAVVWSLLFEVCGLGGGFGPLTLRFLPPVGGLLYWLRPGTIRLPPWPEKVPLTRGTIRTPLDVALYFGVLAAAGWLLVSPAARTDLGPLGPVSMLEPVRLVPLVVLLPLLGLRDKTIFLAARSEHYWVLLLAFFMPFVDLLVAAKLLMVVMWWGAATSKLNRVFPFTVAAMLSNAPLVAKPLRRAMFRAFPRDMRPSRLAVALAWAGMLTEYAAPLVLVVSTSPTATLVAVVVMVLFHLVIITSLPLGVPLEWNAFIIFALGYLFCGHFGANLSTASHPLLPALLAIPLVVLVTWGNLRPDQISFLPAMRYYAGNWATSLWAFTPSAIAKIDAHIPKSCGFVKSQLKRLYSEQVSEIVTHKGYVYRAMHHHGRALFGLLPRAAGPDHEDAIVIEGELVAGALLGWNFGDGHLHNEQLVAAVASRCHFEPGEVRVIELESAPIGSDRQEYRLVDGAVGEFERGYVLVRDMICRQPWEIDDLPIQISAKLDVVPGDRLEEEDELLVPDGPAELEGAARGGDGREGVALGGDGRGDERVIELSDLARRADAARPAYQGPSDQEPDDYQLDGAEPRLPQPKPSAEQLEDFWSAPRTGTA